MRRRKLPCRASGPHRYRERRSFWARGRRALRIARYAGRQPRYLAIGRGWRRPDDRRAVAHHPCHQPRQHIRVSETRGGANEAAGARRTHRVGQLHRRPARFIDPQASERRTLFVSRALVIALGAFALLQAAYFESVLKAALYAYTVYGAAVTPSVMAVFFWKRANK